MTNAITLLLASLLLTSCGVSVPRIDAANDAVITLRTNTRDREIDRLIYERAYDLVKRHYYGRNNNPNRPQVWLELSHVKLERSAHPEVFTFKGTLTIHPENRRPIEREVSGQVNWHTARVTEH